MRKLIFLITLLLASCGKIVEVGGDVFISTRGAGAYKFSAVTVIAVPKETLIKAGESYFLQQGEVPPVEQVIKHLVGALEFLLKSHNDLGEVYSTVTNSDGKFKLSLPSPGEYLITANAERLVGDKKEYNRWFLVQKIETDMEVSLNNTNLLPNLADKVLVLAEFLQADLDKKLRDWEKRLRDLENKAVPRFP